MIDLEGVDTQLARLLHRLGRVDLRTLRDALEEARRGRDGQGPTLARLLAGRGLLREDELARLLEGLRPGSLSESGERLLLESWSAHLRGEVTRVNRPASSEDARRALLQRFARGGDDTVANRPGSTGDARLQASWEVGPPDDESTRRVRPGEEGALEQRLVGDDERAWGPGGRVGAWTLDRRIGMGGMGMVFAAVDAAGQRRAIKTVHANADDETRERFRREAAAQNKVDDHPHVVRVLETGEAHGRPYFVMELVEGGDLDQRIKRGLLGLEEQVRVVAGVARGLAHLHARGVLHRDLKPTNILFDKAGTPKLTDFGLARVEGAAPLTVTGEVLGTPSYMAPEQALGTREDVGTWTDVWSLGAVLFSVFAGRPPFQGATAMETIDQVASEEAPLLRAVCPDAPPAIEALCRACMDHDAAARPTAEQVAERLEAFGSEISAVTRAAARRASRGRALVLLKPLAGAAALAGLIALGFTLGRATAPADGAPDRPDVTSDTPAPPTPATASTPTSPPTPVEVEPEPAWAPGQTRRCVVRAALDGTYLDPLDGPLAFSIEQRLDMTWRVVAVEDEVVRVEATLDALALRSSARPDRPDAPTRWSTDFDAARPGADPRSPLRAALGAPLGVVLDARSGAVRAVEGAAAVQSAVFARAGVLEAAPQDDARSSVRVPLLADEGGLARALDGALRVLPPADAPPAWTVRRERQSDNPLGGALDARVVPDERDPRRLAWTGAFEGTFRTRDERVVQVRRAVEGRAALTPRRDRVQTASYEDTWTMTAQGTERPLMRARSEVTVELGE